MRGFVIFILVCFVFPIGYLIVQSKKGARRAEAARREAAAEKQRSLDEAREWMEKRDAQRRADEAARAEWNTKHGRIVTSLAGVTFDNEDGTSRQKLLKDFMARQGSAELRLEEFEYKGEPGVRVLIDGQCVGNIPRSRVAEVLDVMDRLEKGDLDVEIFYPEDAEDDEEGRARRRGEKIYRADLALIYSK